MPGFESTCALTREAIILTGASVFETSNVALGFEGSLPLRPLRLSVLTTEKTETLKVQNF